jgi:PilZ domain
MANHPIRNGVVRSGERRERAPVAEQDRRSAPRNMLVASAEAEELASGMSLSARTSDISAHGCYLDTINPFSAGTRIRVHLTKGNEIFHSLALVVYAHVGMGMGIAFTEITSDAREIIHRWIAELESGKTSLAPLISGQTPDRGISNDERTPLRLERLVQILVKRGLLTQEEVRQILN